MAIQHDVQSALSHLSFDMDTNVSKPERAVGLIGAPLLAYLAVKKGGIGGIILGLIAAEMAYRGLTGFSPVYKAAGLNTVGLPERVLRTDPRRVERTIYISRPVEEVFAFWRNFENLPRFMDYLDSVKTLDSTRSHWIAKDPTGLIKMEWDAEIVNEIPNELITWMSVAGSSLENSGYVRFMRPDDGMGCRVQLVMEYTPPAGKLGLAVVKLFGTSAEDEIEESLQCFKTLMETGEVPRKGSGKKAPVMEEDVPVRRNIERRADLVQAA